MPLRCTPQDAARGQTPMPRKRCHVSTGRSIGILTLLNLAGAVLAVANSVVIAWFFGTSRALEVFFAASTLQVLLFSLTQTGQLAEVFLPVYHRIRQDRGPAAAHEAFAVIANWMVLAVCGLAAAMWLLAGPLMALLVPGFGSEDQFSAAGMFRALLPLLPLQVYFSLATTLANAERCFGRAEAIGVVSRLGMIVATAALAARTGTSALVAAAYVAAILQIVFCGLMLARMGYRHRLRLRSDHFSARGVFARTATTLGYVGATQVWALAFNAALSRLPQGTFAVFKYVQTLHARTNSVLLRPVSVVFFTHFSQALAAGAQNLRCLVHSALGKSLALLVPVLAAAAVAGRDVLAGLWGWRSFDPARLDLAALLLIVLLGLLLASALGQIARKTTMSLGMVARQYWTSAAIQLGCAALAWWAMSDSRGAIGLIAANEIALAAVPVCLLGLWRRDLVAFYPLGDAARWLLAGAAAVGCGWLAQRLVPLTPLTHPGLLLARGLGLATLTAGAAVLAAGLLGVADVRKLASLLPRPGRKACPPLGHASEVAAQQDDFTGVPTPDGACFSSSLRDCEEHGTLSRPDGAATVTELTNPGINESTN